MFRSCSFWSMPTWKILFLGNVIIKHEFIHFITLNVLLPANKDHIKSKVCNSLRGRTPCSIWLMLTEEFLFSGVCNLSALILSLRLLWYYHSFTLATRITCQCRWHLARRNDCFFLISVWNHHCQENQLFSFHSSITWKQRLLHLQSC